MQNVISVVRMFLRARHLIRRRLLSCSSLAGRAEGILVGTRAGISPAVSQQALTHSRAPLNVSAAQSHCTAVKPAPPLSPAAKGRWAALQRPKVIAGVSASTHGEEGGVHAMGWGGQASSHAENERGKEAAQEDNTQNREGERVEDAGPAASSTRMQVRSLEVVQSSYCYISSVLILLRYVSSSCYMCVHMLLHYFRSFFRGLAEEAPLTTLTYMCPHTAAIYLAPSHCYHCVLTLLYSFGVGQKQRRPSIYIFATHTHTHTRTHEK
jgi:hypothetical protein